MKQPRTDTKTLALAMDVLALNIQSSDGVANAAIKEASDRLMELESAESRLKMALRALKVIQIWATHESLNSHDVLIACESAISAAAMPNDQELSHAAGDSRQPGTRSENCQA